MMTSAVVESMTLPVHHHHHHPHIYSPERSLTHALHMELPETDSAFKLEDVTETASAGGHHRPAHSNSHHFQQSLYNSAIEQQSKNFPASTRDPLQSGTLPCFAHEYDRRDCGQYHMREMLSHEHLAHLATFH